MTDATNEPTGFEPGDTLPTEPIAAPIPEAYDTTPPPPAATPVYAEPVAPTKAAGSDSVTIPKKTLLIGGGVVLALVLLAGTFAFGTAVGSHARRFDGRGPAGYQQMQPGNQYGGMMPGGRGDSDGDGYGHRGQQRGWGGQGQGALPGAPGDQNTTPQP